MGQPNYSEGVGRRDSIPLRPVAGARGGDTTEFPRVEGHPRVQQQPAQRQAPLSWGAIFRSVREKFNVSYDPERFRRVSRNQYPGKSKNTDKPQRRRPSLLWVVVICVAVIQAINTYRSNQLVHEIKRQGGDLVNLPTFTYLPIPNIGMPDIPGGVWHTIITVILTIGAILIISAVRKRLRSGSSDQH